MALTLYRRHIGTCPVAKARFPRAPSDGDGLRVPDLDVRAHRKQPRAPAEHRLHRPRKSRGITRFPDRASKSESAHGVRIDECVQKYLASRTSTNWERRPTARRTLPGRLQELLRAPRRPLHARLEVDLLETFKVDGLPDLADTSKSTVVAKLRCFLRDAFRRGWITNR